MAPSCRSPPLVRLGTGTVRVRTVAELPIENTSGNSYYLRSQKLTLCQKFFSAINCCKLVERSGGKYMYFLSERCQGFSKKARKIIATKI